MKFNSILVLSTLLVVALSPIGMAQDPVPEDFDGTSIPGAAEINGVVDDFEAALEDVPTGDLGDVPPSLEGTDEYTSDIETYALVDTPDAYSYDCSDFTDAPEDCYDIFLQYADGSAAILDPSLNGNPDVNLQVLAFGTDGTNLAKSSDTLKVVATNQPFPPEYNMADLPSPTGDGFVVSNHAGGTNLVSLGDATYSGSLGTGAVVPGGYYLDLPANSFEETLYDIFPDAEDGEQVTMYLYAFNPEELGQSGAFSAPQVAAHYGGAYHVANLFNNHASPLRYTFSGDDTNPGDVTYFADFDGFEAGTIATNEAGDYEVTISLYSSTDEFAEPAANVEFEFVLQADCSIVEPVASNFGACNTGQDLDGYIGDTSSGYRVENLESTANGVVLTFTNQDLIDAGVMNEGQPIAVLHAMAAIPGTGTEHYNAFEDALFEAAGQAVSSGFFTPVFIGPVERLTDLNDGYIAHYDWTGHDETPGGVQVQAAHDGTVTIAATIYEDLSPAPGIGVFLSGSTGESPGFPCPDSSGTGGYCSIVLASATTDDDGVATFTFDEADARMGRPGNAMDLFIQREGASGSSHYQFAKNQLVANGLLMEADTFENYDGVSGVSRAMTPAFFGGGDMDGDGSQNVVEGAIGSDPREWQSQPGLLNIALNPGLEGDDDAADPDGDGVPHVEFRTSTFEATQVAPGAGRGGSDAANLAGEGKVAGHSVLGNIRLDVQQGVEFQDFHSGSFYFKIPSDFPDEIEKTQFRIYMALDGDGDGEFTHVKEDPNSQDHCVVFAEQGFRRDNNPEQYHDWQLVVFDKDTPAGMGPRSGTHCPGVGSDSPPVSEAMAQVPHATILSVSVQTQGYLAGFEHPEGHPIYVDDVALLVDNGPPTDLTDGWAVHIQPTKNNLPLPGASYDLAACRIGDVCPTSYDQAQFMVDQDGYYNFDVYADRVGHGYVDPSPDAGPDDDEFLAQRNTKEGKVTFRGDSKHAGPMTNSVFELRQQTLSGWDVVYRCSAFGPDACVGGGSLVQVPIDEVDTSDPLVAWAFIDVADGQEHDGVQGLEEETHVNSASGYFSIAKNSFEGYAITDLMDWGATPLFFDAYELPVDGFTAGISFPATLNLPGTITTPDGQGYLTATARPYERDAEWYAPQDNRELFLKVIGLDDEGVEVESAWILPEPADEDAGLYTFRVHLSDLPVDAEPANGYDFFVDQWGESGGRSSHHFLAKEAAFNAGEYPLADAMDDSLEGQRLFTPVFVANADLSILPLACIDAADPEGFVAGLEGFGPTSVLELDHDDDGSPTFNEVLAGSDPCNPASTPADWDGDAYTNYEECSNPNNPTADCTDPRDAASHPSDMSADEGPFAATAQPDKMVDLEFTFTNDGRATDSYTVSIELDAGDWGNVSPTVAEQTLFGEGERADTIFIEGVRSQETRTVVAQATVPATIADGAARGDEGVFSIDIEPHADDVATEGQFDFSPLTWTVTTGEVTTYDLVFDQGVETSQSALPAAAVDFPFTVSNTGNFEQDIALTSEYEFTKAFDATPDLGSGYYTVLKADGTTPFGATVSVPAQDSVGGILRVSVPDWDSAAPATGAYAGDNLALTLTADTGDDHEVEVNADVTTLEEYGLALPATASGNGEPGENVDTTATLVNEGNGVATVDWVTSVDVSERSGDPVAPGQVELQPAIVGQTDDASDVDLRVAIPGWDYTAPVEGARADDAVVATFTATYTNGNDATSDAVAFTVTTDQVYAVGLSKESDDDADKSGAPSAEVSLSYTLTNQGNGEDDFGFSFNEAAGTYTYQLPADVEGLAATESATATAKVTIPDWDYENPVDGSYHDDEKSVTLTATSAGDATADDAADSRTLTTTEVFGHLLTPASTSVDVNPEDPTFVPLTLTHTGNGEVTYVLSVSDEEWDEALLDEGSGCAVGNAVQSSAILNAAAEVPVITDTFCVLITPPANLDWNDGVTFTVTATDDQDPTPVSKTAVVTATAKPTYDVETSSPATTMVDTWEGRPVVFEFDVTNNGNGAANFDLSGSSTLAGWTAAFYGHADGACSPDAIQATGDIGEGATMRFCVEITPEHRDAEGDEYPHAQGDVARVDVTATSQALGENGVVDDTWQATVTLCSLNTDEANDQEGDLPDEPCAGADGDLDDDNDGFSDTVEEDALSDGLDKFSTPLDGDGDGIPNAVETFVDFEMQRDEVLSEAAHEEASANGLPTVAIPDATSIELITVYNVRVANSVTQPLTRAFNTPLATLEPGNDGTWTVCVYDIRNPVDGSLTHVGECASGEDAEAFIELVLLQVDETYAETMELLDNAPGIALAVLDDLGITQCPGSPCLYFDETGNPGLLLEAGEGLEKVGVTLDGGEITLTYPTITVEDADEDGSNAVYLESFTQNGDGSMTSNGRDQLAGDEDDNDPNVGGPQDEIIDELPSTEPSEGDGFVTGWSVAPEEGPVAGGSKISLRLQDSYTADEAGSYQVFTGRVQLSLEYASGTVTPAECARASACARTVTVPSGISEFVVVATTDEGVSYYNLDLNRQMQAAGTSGITAATLDGDEDSPEQATVFEVN